MTNSDPDCEFCTITLADAAPIVYQDVNTVAFLPLSPAADGHTLVIPRTHIPDIFSLDVDAAAHLARTVLAVATALRSALKPEGLNVINSAGRAASQTVFHLHVHILPRWAGDRIGNIWPPSEPVNKDRERLMLARVRRELATQEPSGDR